MQPERTAAEAIAAARERLPMERLANDLGISTQKNAPCPFCEKKGHSGFYNKVQGRPMPYTRFRCFTPGCTAERSMDEVALIGAIKNLSNKEAFKEYLRMAGVK